MTTTGAKKIHLRSSDLQDFEVEEAVALRSQTIKNMIDGGYENDIIPLPIKGSILAKVIEYCSKHHKADVEAEAQGQPQAESDSTSSSTSPSLSPAVVDYQLWAWDAKFVNLDFPALFHLIRAANYLDVKDMLALTARAVADKIADKKPEEVRKIFKIKNDHT